MNKIHITRLTDEQEKKLSKDFLNMIGKVIHKNRTKHNISQKELAECLEVSESSISNYENGNQDMPVTKLPLISTYCGFNLNEYFQPEIINYVKTFKSLVSIEKRKIEKSSKQYIENSRRELVSQTYYEDGKYITEKVNRKPIKLSFKDSVLYGTKETAAKPFDDNELSAYLESSKCVDIIKATSQIMNYTDSYNNKNTIKGQLADFMLNEIFIERYKNNDRQAERVYAYYKQLLDK
ncbi:MAG: helix-turn-helix transcriptional regulator [Lachnospira sp.]